MPNIPPKQDVSEVFGIGIGVDVGVCVALDVILLVGCPKAPGDAAGVMALWDLVQLSMHSDASSPVFPLQRTKQVGVAGVGVSVVVSISAREVGVGLSTAKHFILQEDGFTVVSHFS